MMTRQPADCTRPRPDSSSRCAPDAARQPPAPAPAPSGHWVGSHRRARHWRRNRSRTPGRRAGAARSAFRSQGTKGIPLADVTVKKDQRRVRDQGRRPAIHASAARSPPTGRPSPAPSARAAHRFRWCSRGRASRSSRPPVKNAAVSPALLGTWEGALDIKGTMLRLVLTLANGPDGAIGKLVSLDQNNFEMPGGAASPKTGSRLKLTVADGERRLRRRGQRRRDLRAPGHRAAVAAAGVQEAALVPILFELARCSARMRHRCSRDGG